MPLRDISLVLTQADPASAHRLIDRHAKELAHRLSVARDLLAAVRRCLDEEEPDVTFDDALRQVLPAVGDRGILSSVLVEGLASGVRVVGADSYRLAIREAPVVAGLDDGDRILIPADVARRGGVRMEDGIPAGPFPDYRPVLSHEPRHRLVVRRATLLEFAERARATVVPLLLGDDVSLGSHALPGRWDGPPLALGVHPGFLADGLRCLSGDEVQLALTDHCRPIWVREDDFLYLVMPSPLT